MERLIRRLSLARQALDTLLELSGLPKPSQVERDAAIQRFEYTVESCWKAAQAVLDTQFGIAVASPKPVIRACAQNGLLTEDDAHAAMAMIDDRNLTSHAYNQDLAVAIHSRLADHAGLLGRWLTAMEQVAKDA
ncbi:MAG: nucleotidyltransferase substrate binding protein [Hydrogenophilales bacterium]|nr:nucleotidyltransferase substrate binding protein [Hydrogenophilales bacterium]